MGAAAERSRPPHPRPSPVIITLVGLIEPSASIHARLTFHPRHAADLRLRRQNNAVIVFGMLQIVLGSDRVAGRHRVSRQRGVFLRDVHGCTADLDVRDHSIRSSGSLHFVAYGRRDYGLCGFAVLASWVLS